VQKICSRVAIIKEGRVISIQKIKELREFGYKKIELTAKEEFTKGYFAGDVIADYQQTGNQASFIYQGEVAAIVEKLHRLQITIYLLKSRHLKRSFLHYYE